MKLTEWYPAYVKPVREGWYQCKCCMNCYYWRAGAWRHSKNTQYKNAVFDGWRGLAKEPK